MTKAEATGLTQEAVAALATTADLLDLLIRLHDREADSVLLDGLRDEGAAQWFADALSSPDGQAAAALLQSALEALPASADEKTLDALAAEYADIYLTHGYRVSPSGSVWLTEDRLERQLPMFEVRDWYAHYDIAVPDWRIRADDHIVHELQFLSFLLRRGNLVAAQDAARFMDLLVLPWVPVFLAEGRPRLREDLYRASFDLTGALLEELRDQLEALTGQAREARPGVPVAGQRVPEEETAFMPGVSESW